MLGRTNLTLTNRMLSAILLAVAVVGAVALIWMSQTGGYETAVFVAVSVVVTVAVLASGELGLMAIIFVAATDGFLKGLSPGWHTQLLKDYLIAICLLRWAWMSVLGHRRESVRLPVALPILIFAGWVGVQFFNARSGSVLMSLAGVRMWLIWLPTFFLAYDIIDTREKVERLLLFIVALMVPICVYAIIQYNIGLDHLFRLGPGFSVHSHDFYGGSLSDEWRPPSTMISPHALAGTLAMVVLMAIGLGFYFARNRLLQLMILTAVPLMATVMLLTAVRNAVASAAIGLVALVIVRRRFDLAVLLAVVGVIAIVQVDAMTTGQALQRIRSIVEHPQYTTGRIRGPWRSATRRIANYPLGMGVASRVGAGRLLYGRHPGRGTSGEAIPFVENEYGRALLELGIPGFILFMWMLWRVMRGNYRAYANARQIRDRWLVAGIFAACVSMLARLLVGPSLYGWPEAPIFWYLVAIALRVRTIENDELMRSETSNAENRAVVLGQQKLPWARDNQMP